MGEPDQAAAGQAGAFSAPGIVPPAAPAGFEEFFGGSFRELVRATMYVGATLQEAEDAAAKALMEMLSHWDTCERSLAYARKAAVHNFIKDKTRGTSRVARRLIERGHVSCQEGAEDRQLTVWEDSEWIADVLNGLPPAQREVMECIVKGIDRHEIAEALGKTREAIRRHLCDARARLSRELDVNGEHIQSPNRERKRQLPRKMARTPRQGTR